MANPYLALAVSLASAMDGIRRAEEPPLALDENLVRYDDTELIRWECRRYRRRLAML